MKKNNQQYEIGRSDLIEIIKNTSTKDDINLPDIQKAIYDKLNFYYDEFIKELKAEPQNKDLYTQAINDYKSGMIDELENKLAEIIVDIRNIDIFWLENINISADYKFLNSNFFKGNYFFVERDIYLQKSEYLQLINQRFIENKEEEKHKIIESIKTIKILGNITEKIQDYFSTCSEWQKFYQRNVDINEQSKLMDMLALDV